MTSPAIGSIILHRLDAIAPHSISRFCELRLRRFACSIDHMFSIRESNMKPLLFFFALLLSASPLAAGIIVETTVVSAEEIIAGKTPLACEVQRRKDGRISVKLSLKESKDVKGTFDGFDLRVMKTPLPPHEIKDQVVRAEPLAWHRPFPSRAAFFVLTEEEIARGYVMASWSLGKAPNGMFQVKNVALSVEALADAMLPKATRAAELKPQSQAFP